MKHLRCYLIMFIIATLFYSCEDSSEDKMDDYSYPYYYEFAYCEFSKVKMITSSEVTEDVDKIKDYLKGLSSHSLDELALYKHFEFNQSKIYPEEEDKYSFAKKIGKDSVVVFLEDRNETKVIKRQNNITYWESQDTVNIFYPLEYYSSYRFIDNLYTLSPLYEFEPDIPTIVGSSYSYRVKPCIYVKEENDVVFMPMCSFVYSRYNTNDSKEFIGQFGCNNSFQDNKTIQGMLRLGEAVIVQEYRLYLIKTKEERILNKLKSASSSVKDFFDTFRTIGGSGVYLTSDLH